MTHRNRQRCRLAPRGGPTAYRFALLLCAALLLLPARPAAAKFDPAFTWTVLETPHFLIYYHQGGEDIARRAAVIAEDVNARLVPRMKWTPKGRTRLVLADFMDESNGLASPFPYNQIVVSLARPAGQTGLGLVSVDDWLRLVITHEYTHILQLDMVTGGPKTLRHIIGRIYFPNLFQPIWMIEGLATYEETEQTSGGRGRSPGSEMVLRMASLENAFPSLGQASVFPDSWPAGQVPYLFGEAFTRYLVDRFGRETVADISVAYSGRDLPFRVTSTGRQVLYRSYQDLWNEWEQSLRHTFEQQRDAIAAKGLTGSVPLTRKGFVNTSPAFSPDGKLIAYAEARGDEYPGLMVMNADGSGARKVVENVFPSSGTEVSWSPDGRLIYYTRIEITRNTDDYTDLYVYDLAARRETRLTKGLRARDPRVSPDGRRLVFVMDRLGLTRLAFLDLTPGRTGPARAADVTTVGDWSDIQYGSPCWSPDGTRIAVAAGLPGGTRAIRIIDVRSGEFVEATNGRAINDGPAWSPDGATLYFTSDRSGVFNIYAFDVATKDLYQVTNVLGGAFAPAPSPDGGTLAFADYSSRGYDIHAMPVDRASWKHAGPPAVSYPAVRYEDRPVETTSRPCSPFPTLAPRFWLPWFGYSYESGVMAGALTLGQDVLQRHSYLATVLYGPKNGRVWYGFDYFYDRWYPTLHLTASDTDVTYTDFLRDPQGEKDYVERERTVGADLILPVLKYARQQELTVGYRKRDRSSLSDLPPWPGYTGPLPAEGDLVSGLASYRFNSAHRYAFSISPEDGRMVEIGVERFDRSLGSDFEFTKYTADWHEYVDLWVKHQVLVVRAFGGTSTGDAPPQGAYQLGGDNPGDVTLTLDDTSLTLRGYPMNVLRGRKAALGSLEYRFPIENLEDGWNTKAIFFRRFHGAVFFDAGSAWDGAYRHDELRRSAGAEMRFDLTLAYYLPVTVRFVFAHGFDRDGETQAYVGLWVPFGL